MVLGRDAGEESDTSDSTVRSQPGRTLMTRFGGSPRRVWKIKAVPKLRILKSIASPLKLMSKLKNAYINMMLGMAGNVDGTNVFGNKRVPRGRQVKAPNYPSEAFEKRLVYEIYKNLLATRELSTVKISN
jgi:hypothetical protein